MPNRTNTDEVCFSRNYPMQIAIVLILLVVAALALASMSELINADTLTSLTFASDFLHHASLSSWQLAPAPAILSEILPSILALSLSENPFGQLAIIQFFQLTLLFLTLFFFGRTFSFSHPSAIALISILVLTFGTVFENFWLFHIANNMHMGAVFLGINSLCLLALAMRSNKMVFTQLILLFSLGVLAVLESKLYYVHFTFPAVGLLLFLVTKGTPSVSKFRFYVISATLLGAFFGGLFISYQFHSLNATNDLPLSGIENLRISIKTSRETLQYFLFHYGDPFVRSAVLALVWLFYKKIKSKDLFRQVNIQENNNDFIALWIIGTSAIIFITFFATGRLRMPIYDLRYFTLPLILTLYLFINWSCKTFSTKGIVIFCGFVFVAPLFSAIRGYKVNEQFAPLIQCLGSLQKESGLRAGISGYWFAKPIQYYSNYGIHMAQITPDFKEFKWMNRLDLLSTTRAGDRPDFNFIVEDWWLSHKQIEDKFGKADKIFECTAGPFNNGFMAYKNTIVKIHFYSSGILNNFATSLDTPATQ